MKYTRPKSDRAIKNLAESERPREKLATKGSEALSDSELIAILIQSGNHQKSAVDLAREVLKLGNQSLFQLGKLSLADFKQIKGIGIARAVILVAALELGRRRQLSESLEVKEINSSKVAAEILIPLMADLTHERFCVFCLNASNKLLHYEFISSGGPASTAVDPKVIFNVAIQCMAAKLIVAHNHPSGNLKPSMSDKLMTKRIVNGAQILGISLVDHLIISDNRYFSFADDGLL